MSKVVLPLSLPDSDGLYWSFCRRENHTVSSGWFHLMTFSGSIHFPITSRISLLLWLKVLHRGHVPPSPLICGQTMEDESRSCLLRMLLLCRQQQVFLWCVNILLFCLPSAENGEADLSRAILISFTQIHHMNNLETCSLLQVFRKTEIELLRCPLHQLEWSKPFAIKSCFCSNDFKTFACTWELRAPLFRIARSWKQWTAPSVG